MRTLTLTPLFLLLAACSGGSTPAADAGPTDSGLHADAASSADAGEVDASLALDAGGEPDAGQAACPEIQGEVVSLSTEDGQQLAADLYTTGAAGRPAVVLLHMIPPSNTRANYPRAFIDALLAKGLTVLNVDRRGAGGSAALARTAYTGPNGKWDAKAAVDFLTQHPCAPSPDKIAIVGASNGTTTAFDYAVYAANQADVPSPAALVFLTGGAYTETNNTVAGQRAVLEALPVQFVFSTAERAWSADLMSGAPAGWSFQEYDPGEHGTRMLTRRTESVAAVADFLQAQLQ